MDPVEKPVMIMLRGLPGSGKSTLAAALSERGKYPVCSVDSYFTDPATGEYNFDYRQNHQAYRQCEEQARYMMQQGVAKVLVDNTFTMEWEMAPYFKLAADLGYRVFVVTVENRHGQSNIHGVTQEQLEKMVAKYQVKLL